MHLSLARIAIASVVPLSVVLACSDDEKKDQDHDHDAGSGGSATGSGGRGSGGIGGAQGGRGTGGAATGGAATGGGSATGGSGPTDGGDVCHDLGHLCHEVDPGTGAIHDCHETGHDGDQAACSAALAGCKTSCGAALCTFLGSLCHGLAASGPLQDCHELGHAGDAGACFDQAEHCLEICRAARADGGADGGHPEGGHADAGMMSVTIQFKAKVGSAAFACGTNYANQGSSGTQATPRSLRFYVNELKLKNHHGDEVPVMMDTRAPWQTPEVALIDFADAAGLCGQQTPEVNTIITGMVPQDTYDGVVFGNGVPETLNHGDPATAPAPLQAGLSWGWLFGHIFLQAELQNTAGVADGGDPGLGLLHLGSTGCDNAVGDGGPNHGAPPAVACTNQNRNRIELTGFDPATNSIVFDLGALFASADLTVSGQCHSAGTFCDPWFAAAGVNFATGAALTTQSVYSVE